MKTIDKRAKEYAYNLKYGYDYIAEEGYKNGAKEQKQIDIDRACEWLKITTQCGVHPCSSNSFIEDFRKFMEE